MYRRLLIIFHYLYYDYCVVDRIEILYLALFVGFESTGWQYGDQQFPPRTSIFLAKKKSSLRNFKIFWSDLSFHGIHIIAFKQNYQNLYNTTLTSAKANNTIIINSAQLLIHISFPDIFNLISWNKCRDLK